MTAQNLKKSQFADNTKYNSIIGQCVQAEIMCYGFERKLLVNTGWPIYKVQSVLETFNTQFIRQMVLK